MAEIDADYVRSIAPEFEDVGDTRINFWITETASMVNDDVWGQKACLAKGLLVAHQLTLQARQGRAGSIKREKVGDLEKEWENNSDSDSSDDLDTTTYGQQYKRLRKCLVITPRVVGCLNP